MVTILYYPSLSSPPSLLPLGGFGRERGSKRSPGTPHTVDMVESILHRISIAFTPFIPVSMLVLGFKAGGVISLHVEDGASERAQHWNGDTKGHSIIYAEYVPPTVINSCASLCCNGWPWYLLLTPTKLCVYNYMQNMFRLPYVYIYIYI